MIENKSLKFSDGIFKIRAKTLTATRRKTTVLIENMRKSLIHFFETTSHLIKNQHRFITLKTHQKIQQQTKTSLSNTMMKTQIFIAKTSILNKKKLHRDSFHDLQYKWQNVNQRIKQSALRSQRRCEVLTINQKMKNVISVQKSTENVMKLIHSFRNVNTARNETESAIHKKVRNQNTKNELKLNLRVRSVIIMQRRTESAKKSIHSTKNVKHVQNDKCAAILRMIKNQNIKNELKLNQRRKNVNIVQLRDSNASEVS